MWYTTFSIVDVRTHVGATHCEYGAYDGILTAVDELGPVIITIKISTRRKVGYDIKPNTACASQGLRKCWAVLTIRFRKMDSIISLNIALGNRL